MKRSIQALLLFAVCSIVISCTKDIAPKTTVDLSTDVIVKDKSGNNLLINTSTGSYKVEDIRLYNLESGARAELVNSGANRYFEVLKDQTGQTVLRISPTAGKNSKTITTAIQWRVNDEDIIEIGIASDSKAGHTSCNGKTTPQSSNPNARRVVEIIK